MRKGEIQQVFIYLMVIIIVGTLLLVGYKAIGGLINKGCDVEFATFKTVVAKALDENSEYASIARLSIKTPCDYEKLCFVDQELDTIDDSITEYPAIYLEWKEKTDANIFVVKNGIVESIDSFEGLSVEGGFLCVESKGGNYNFRVEGIIRGNVLVKDLSPYTPGLTVSR